MKLYAVESAMGTSAMKCIVAEQLMSAYYDGELSADTRWEMRGHLTACGDCSQLLTGFRRVSQLALQLPDVAPPPPQLWNRIQNRISRTVHDREPTFWFGDRPTISARCGGTPVRIVQLDHLIAATWNSGHRPLTIIGVRNIEELLRLVSRFENAS